MPLEEAVWRHQVGCWRPEPLKHKVRWQRGGLGDKRVGSEEATCRRPTEGPPCSAPLCHPVAETWLASTGLLTSGGPLVLCL